MANKRITWSKVLNIVLILIVILVAIPATRSIFQKGLMKLGFFQPDLKTPVVQDAEKPPIEPESSLQASTDGSQVSFQDDGGKILKIQELKGKVVFLNFWATWCPPCKAEMPSIQALKDKFEGDQADKIAFLLVELEQDKEKAHAFMKEGGMDLPIFYPASEIPPTWLGQSIPTTLILDKEGNVAAHHEGMADYSTDNVFEFITELINK
ncbi:TlpA family protein disulfide reductase [Sphingobacterium shayense]|uniref:TlpA family protein disulfide reductase n=1 Tax=Sphingobacterium shayense TaxID=626343 RepID=UPI001556F2A0|nr:TlpA disulfide reductase family protein [Sphingobacterium shayense]NQD72217.1 TlpA family protein disulfide reductase [Sphingobacterium shayense]